jgi:hypothetical protein
MTIRDGETGGPAQPLPPPVAERVRRPLPDAAGPNRASTSARRDDTGPASAETSDDLGVSDAVAQVVKLGYDVIAENIQLGRQSAERFSKGKYRIGEAPGDLEVAAQRMLRLARELSTTTFDVCERLLKNMAAQTPPADRTKPPPFRSPTPHKAAEPAPTNAYVMKVTVEFEGAPNAISHTANLDRPRRPTAATDVVAQPLAPSDGNAAPIGGVAFRTDLSVGGIIATVIVPADQPPGVYSGLVRVKGDPLPLGVLTIELSK